MSVFSVTMIQPALTIRHSCRSVSWTSGCVSRSCWSDNHCYCCVHKVTNKSYQMNDIAIDINCRYYKKRKPDVEQVSVHYLNSTVHPLVGWVYAVMWINWLSVDIVP